MTQDRAMRAFIIHLGLFVLIVGLLAGLNIYRNPQKLWFVWVLAGWGIGVAAHDLALLLRRSERQDPVFADPQMRGFFIHLFVYLSVNALLVIVNVLYTPEHYWFVYPLFGWGLALAFHAFQVFRHRRKGAPA